MWMTAICKEKMIKLSFRLSILKGFEVHVTFHRILFHLYLLTKLKVDSINNFLSFLYLKKEKQTINFNRTYKMRTSTLTKIIK